MKQVHSAGIITYIKDTTRYPSTRRRQGSGGQAAFTTEPDEVSGRAGKIKGF